VALVEITYPYTWYDVPELSNIHVLVSVSQYPRKLPFDLTNVIRYNDTDFGRPRGAHPSIPYAFYMDLKKGDLQIDRIYFAVTSKFLFFPSDTPVASIQENPEVVVSMLERKGAIKGMPFMPGDEELIAFTIPFKLLKYSLLPNTEIKLLTIQIPAGIYKTPVRLYEYISQGFNTNFKDWVDGVNGERACRNELVRRAENLTAEQRQPYPLIPTDTKRLVKEYFDTSGQLRLTVDGFGGQNHCTIYKSAPWLLSAFGLSEPRITASGHYVVEFAMHLISYPPNSICNSEIFVYCNIIEEQVVGNTMSSLLRAVTVPSGHSRGELVNEKFIMPYYLPVWRTKIRDIHIEYRDSMGKLITFQSGFSKVVLHFRKLSI
jgi:hypothetical protein